MINGRNKFQNVEEHSSMVLFSSPSCPESHRVRFVLAEKDVLFNLAPVLNLRNPPEDLIAVNPRGKVPTLADRNLVLYEPRIISEYIDERFPHPPLMPVEPMPRARLRLLLHHIEEQWYPRLKRIMQSRQQTSDRARKELRENVLAHAEIFSLKRFLLSDEFSLVDCAVAPILWRLPSVGIELPPKAGRAVARYREQVFSRPGFIRSLSGEERNLSF